MPEGLFGDFEISDSHRADELLARLHEMQWSVGIRPIRQRRDGGVIVHTEAALVDIQLGTADHREAAPEVTIARAVAERRLMILELEANAPC